MAPSLTQNDLTDGIVAKTKFLADTGHSFASGMAGSYLHDDLGGKSLGVTSILERVASISLRGNPFKVGKNVIGPDKINMVDLRQVVRIWNESNSHKAMNHKSFSFPVLFRKSDAAVSVLVGFRREDFGRLGYGLGLSNPSVSYCPTKTTNSSDAGDFVQCLETGDRSPFLISHAASPKAVDLTMTVNARAWGNCQYKELNACP